ncbi:FAD/NAD(P)-binding protein [Sphingobium sufflavum]|uniref:FAD/NAD(P)-binding protein n=1 Tax=Sphingobium sufflavum TaxID=1129547 RepID=UPI001F40A982|nr:FAD/NAD(P)-binding protein [Sphingobium sufflavum]MCE7796128.1 FAD/NAD(P)-binding protein [Sphingobium sufflavum]
MYQDSHHAGRERTIAVIGGGFSGTLLAINLLRHCRGRVLLIEREPDRLGRGLAYGTDNPEHMLNVRASNMSAFPDDLDHFSRWLSADGREGEKEGTNRFVPRRVYGRYLAEQLHAARAEAPGRLELVDGQVVSANPQGNGQGEGWSLGLADGTVRASDIVVLAQGNFAPGDLAVFDTLGPDIYFPSPWGQRLTNRLGREDSVLLIGSGLTAIDAALSMEADGFDGRITALSRRGLRPRPHALVGPHVDRVDRPRETGTALLRAVRNRAGVIGWRGAVDELRPYTQDIWRGMSLDDRRRFLRHLRPYWDAHRHRLAPAVDRKICTLQMEGRLNFVAGKIVSATRKGDSARIEWRVRGTDLIRVETVRRVINCTGPSGDIAQNKDALLDHLRRRGLVRQDPLRLGVDVDRQSHVVDAEGKAHRSLLAVGPMTRAESWEIMAVPDIRRQVWEVARRLGNAHWVAGEGL